MKNPMFQVGERVVHKGKNKIGVVMKSFHDGVGGFRYYVDHSGWRWSVPEWALDTTLTLKMMKNALNDIKHLRGK